MNLNDAKATLSKYQGKDTKTQHENVFAINEAFKVLLSSNPSEDEFQKYLSKVILTPSMLYQIWKGYEHQT